MMMTNTWDVPIYGLLLGVWFLIDLLKEQQNWWIILSLELFWSDGFGFFTLVGKVSNIEHIFRV